MYKLGIIRESRSDDRRVPLVPTHIKDLLSAFKFLLSEETKYINGQNIIIDDGWSI